MIRDPERTTAPRVAPLLGAVVGFLVGCDQDGAIVERKAPKGVEIVLSENDPIAHDHAHERGAHASGVEGVEWDAPSGWSEAPNDNPTRIAVFGIEGAPDVEVVVTRFPGDVGGALANVNRWRAQIGLEPLDGSSLEAHIERLSVPGFNAYLYSATNAERGLVAVGLEEPSRSRTWFVKATSGAHSFDLIRDDVLAFARSFRVPSESE